jgi:hypothetical protein
MTTNIKERREIPCKCGSYQVGWHMLLCSEMTPAELKQQTREYYNAWIESRDHNSNKWGLERRKYHKEIEYWRGKFLAVKQENNKLRKKLQRLKEGDSSDASD